MTSTGSKQSEKYESELFIGVSCIKSKLSQIRLILCKYLLSDRTLHTHCTVHIAHTHSLSLSASIFDLSFSNPLTYLRSSFARFEAHHEEVLFQDQQTTYNLRQFTSQPPQGNARRTKLSTLVSMLLMAAGSSCPIEKK